MRRGDAGRRLDASFHHPALHQNLQRLENSPFNVATLGTLLSSQNGIRYGTGTPPPIVEPSNESVPFIRATDIKDGEIIVSGLLHISAEQEKSMKKCLVQGNELIIVRSGVNTGDCTVVPKSLAGSYAAYDLILQFSNEVVPAFVSAFLNTQSGRAQLNVLKGRAAQPHLNAEEVSSVKIPLPPIDIQQRLVSDLETAREVRKRKLAEVDALLAGIDGFLLEKLGLKLPEEDKKLTFAVRLRGIKNRCDVDFQKPYFKAFHSALKKATFKAYTLGEITKSIFQGVGKNETDNPDITLLKVKNITRTGEIDYTETEYVQDVPKTKILQSGDIISPFIGEATRQCKFAVFKRKDVKFAVDNNTGIIRVDEGKALGEYVAAVLNSSIGKVQLDQLVGGGGVPFLGAVNAATLLISLPPLSVQQSIAAEITRRREEARRLRAETAKEWEEAKKRFERELLGDKV